ncbi:serine hydrolase [Clostridium sp. D53t1_180928_C8]|uniref:serine hydrolase n=1 Tax=Clostridium sp. D53t1_180928_C8 TaxID=2787101 RepID=UPI0018AAEE95|nr:serine hydrolase [Clostridium sp. D53t1_180928_C8]
MKIINNESIVSRPVNFKGTLSIEISAILSNKGFNYSLIYADINNQNYLFLSNYSTDIKNTPSPSASIIKIYIMIALYTKISHGLLNSTTKITLQDSMKVGGSGILYYKDSYTEYSIDDLIYLMITESDNTATNILIDLIGKDYINSKIKKLGCINTSLNRKMMDINALNLGIDNYTSVYDLYITFIQLLNNSCINEFYDNKMINILKNTKSTTKLPNLLPPNTIVAHKTGELTNIENDAGIMFTDNGGYILCVLTKNGKNNIEIQAISSVSKKIYDLYVNCKSKEY